MSLIQKFTEPYLLVKHNMKEKKKEYHYYDKKKGRPILKRWGIYKSGKEGIKD